MSELPKFSLLLVDDEPDVLFAYATLFRSAGFERVTTEADSRQVMPLLEREPFSLVLLDLQMPHLGGYELLLQIRERFPLVQVIIVTAANEFEVAVACIRGGALDYCTKPVEKNRLIASVRRAQEAQECLGQIEALREQVLGAEVQDRSFDVMVSCSEGMRRIFRYLSAVAKSCQPVLICGETGTGKELAARAVHAASGRKGEFVALNLAGVDEQMLCDTLFGHVRGAFTGALDKRRGMVAQANGGTLFLDEIGDLSLASQVKLLRLLQEGEYFPVGSDTPRRADVRIVAATHRDLPSLMTAGIFRADLYYRLCTHQVVLPPLRERREDLPLLLNHLISQAAEEMHKTPPPCPPQLLSYLETARFPGNVRELQGLVRDAVACHSSGMLSMESFLAALGPAATTVSPALPAGEGELRLQLPDGSIPTLKQAEELLIAQALRLSGNNQGVAARYLGITRQALNKRLNR